MHSCQLDLWLQSNLENLGRLVGGNADKMFASLLRSLAISNLEMITAFWANTSLMTRCIQYDAQSRGRCTEPCCVAQSVTELHE